MEGYARMIDGLPETDDNLVKLNRIINENKDNIKKVVDAIAKNSYDFYQFAFHMKQYDGNNNTDYAEHCIMDVQSIPLIMRMIVKSNKWSKAKNLMEPDPHAWFEFNCGSENSHKISYNFDKKGVAYPYIVQKDTKIVDENDDEIKMLGIDAK